MSCVLKNETGLVGRFWWTILFARYNGPDAKGFVTLLWSLYLGLSEMHMYVDLFYDLGELRTPIKKTFVPWFKKKPSKYENTSS